MQEDYKTNTTSDEQLIKKAQARLKAMKKLDKEKGQITDYGTSSQRITTHEFCEQIKNYSEFVEEYKMLLKRMEKISEKIEADGITLSEMYTQILITATKLFGEESQEVNELRNQVKKVNSHRLRNLRLIL